MVSANPFIINSEIYSQYQEVRSVQCKTPGDVLRKLRTDRGLTQQAVAEALNVNRSTYSFHETGKTQPDLQRVTALSKIFDVPLEQMVALLSNPEGMECAAKRKRASKKVAAKPEAIGELRPEEKSLIAVFRSSDPATRAAVRNAANWKGKP